MDQEVKHSIILLRGLSVFFLCFLRLLYGNADSASTESLLFHLPPSFLKNLKIFEYSSMNESLHLSSGSSVFPSLPVLSLFSVSTEFSSWVPGNSSHVLFFNSEKLILEELVLAAEPEPILVPRPLRSRTLLKKQIISSNFNIGKQFLPFYFCFSASMAAGNYSGRMIRSRTFQFEKSGKNDISLGIFPPVLAIISALSAFWSYLKNLFKPKRNAAEIPSHGSLVSSPLLKFRAFKYAELSAATNGFDEKELLGSGIISSLYRAAFPESDAPYVVKRFNRSFPSLTCYETEVRTIHHLRHQNILELKGWCNEIPNEPLLLYEYMPNKSLYDIHASHEPLSWPQRYNIAVGIARALAYLHHECSPAVIHSDINEESVLLDEDFNPKLGEFGLAISNPSDILPECQLQEWVTPKIDVFLYGSMVLELCCRRAERFTEFVGWLRMLKSEGKLIQAVDVRLERSFDEEEMLRLLNVGLECIDREAKKRPSMERVLQLLVGNGEEKDGSTSFTIKIDN